jgi:hypothetical protein
MHGGQQPGITVCFQHFLLNGIRQHRDPNDGLKPGCKPMMTEQHYVEHVYGIDRLCSPCMSKAGIHTQRLTPTTLVVVAGILKA